jgi:hypothetical protein
MLLDVLSLFSFCGADCSNKLVKLNTSITTYCLSPRVVTGIAFYSKGQHGR